MTAQTLPWLNWYIFVQWQLHFGCLASVKSTTRERLQFPFTEAIFVAQSSAAQRSRVHLHQPGIDQDDLSVMKADILKFKFKVFIVNFSTRTTHTETRQDIS